ATIYTLSLHDALPISGQKKHAWMYVAIVGAVLSIGLFFLGRYGFRNATSSSSELPGKSIAVLPFDNLSRDPDNAYFAEGVQDERSEEHTSELQSPYDL